MTPARALLSIAALVTAAFSFSGAGGAAIAGSHGATSHSTSVAGAATLRVHSSRYGKILFDGRGRVLYLFARDQGSRSTCYGACAQAWPPFLAKDAPRGTRGVDAKLLGTTKRKDGAFQVTYAKHPLYFFKEDTKPGEIKCQNVSNFGGLWLVVAPNGNPVR